MIYYSISTLMFAQIKKIMIVSTPSDLPILKKRIKFAAESLYNYILFDSYGCQGYNIVKVYKSIRLFRMKRHILLSFDILFQPQN